MMPPPDPPVAPPAPDAESSDEQEQAARRKTMQRGVLANALIDGLGSYLVYILLHHHTSEFKALAWSMLPPALNNLWSLARKRHLDIFGVIIIAGLCAGLGLVLLGGSPRLLLVRDSLITGLVGLVFLGSLFLRRPLLFYALRQLAAGTDTALAAEWDARYTESPSHLGLPLMTGVWGTMLVAEAALRTVCALKMPIPVFLAVWPFVNIAMYAGTSLWSFWYGRRVQDREDAPTSG